MVFDKKSDKHIKLSVNSHISKYTDSNDHLEVNANFYVEVLNEIKVEVQEEKRFQIIDLLKKELEQKNITFLDIDGIKVILKEGWFLQRASNTQNYITAETKVKIMRISEGCKTYRAESRKTI